MPDSRPLILTAHLDEPAQNHFNALRRVHFPPERNYLDAHLTLFHKLPGGETVVITDHLSQLAAKTSIMPAQSLPPYSLGRGVAFAIDCPQLISLRNDLAATWQHWLPPQDKQPFKPHITIQNKVEPITAATLLTTLKNEKPVSFRITGLQLWHYDGGPWSAPVSFHFS